MSCSAAHNPDRVVANAVLPTPPLPTPITTLLAIFIMCGSSWTNEWRSGWHNRLFLPRYTLSMTAVYGL